MCLYVIYILLLLDPKPLKPYILRLGVVGNEMTEENVLFWIVLFKNFH